MKRHLEIEGDSGVVIRMYFNDNKKHYIPHFQTFYGEHEAVITLTGEVLEGNLPRKQLSLVVAWAIIHEEDLKADWSLAISGESFFRIEPLK